MWNDEDNNPYSALDHQEPHFSDSLHSDSISPSKYLSVITAMPFSFGVLSLC